MAVCTKLVEESTWNAYLYKSKPADCRSWCQLRQCVVICLRDFWQVPAQCWNEAGEKLLMLRHMEVLLSEHPDLVQQ